MSRLRKQNKAADPHRMFRHFALATVAITALVAVFADGETREAMVARVEKERIAAEMRAAQVRQAQAHKREQRSIAAATRVYQEQGGVSGDIGPEVPAGDGGLTGDAGTSPPPFAFADSTRDRTLMPATTLRAKGVQRPQVLPQGMAPEDYDENANLSRRVGAARTVTQSEYQRITEASAQRSSLQAPVE